MLDSFNNLPNLTYFIRNGVVYHGKLTDIIDKYHHFVSYTHRHLKSQHIIYQLDLSANQKRIAKKYDFLNADIDLDNLLIHIARGNIEYVIVDKFDESTCELFNAIRYAEAPNEKVMILRPIPTRYVCNWICKTPEKVDFTRIDKDTYICNPKSVEAYEYFSVINTWNNSESGKCLKIPPEVDIDVEKVKNVAIWF